MKYFWLWPKDQRYNNWLFHSEDNERGVRLREPYLPLRCRKCKKFDELKALKLGISPEVKIRSKSDYLISDDGLILISNAGQELFATEGIEGVHFLQLPGDDRYAIALPNEFVATNRELSGMEFHRLCPNCGRFRETCFSPVIASMNLQGDPHRIYCPDLPIEDTRGRRLKYLAPQHVVAILRRRKFSGVEYGLVD